jgi:hypothetical protein
VHSLIYAIGLCLIDNCLLGPAAAALKERARRRVFSSPPRLRFTDPRVS